MTHVSSHYKNFRYSNVTEKYHMTCKYCIKELIDSKNTNGKVSYLYSVAALIDNINKNNSVILIRYFFFFYTKTIFLFMFF